MTIRFLHSADWQIGKVFRFVDQETMGVLQNARLNAIDRLGKIAVEQELRHVLVAGDVYDAENLSTKSLNQPLERMRKYADVNWYLLPGNHDPNRTNGLWYRLRRGLPKNVHICDESDPLFIESDTVAILPAPLHHKSTLEDPTEYMDSVDIPGECIRIGLAHGSVSTFGAGEGAATNYINPDRPNTAGLAYLALGDWHGQREVNSRCWYSGTPETDAFDVTEGGKALIVSVNSNTSVPKVKSVLTGEFRWETISETVASRSDIERLRTKLSGLDDHLERYLVRLQVEGLISLEERTYFDEIIAERFEASFLHFDLDDEHLHVKVTDDDIAMLDIGGFVKAAVDELRNQLVHSDEQVRKLAAQALTRLYVELKRMEAD